jgi:hypothetical protein
VKGVVLKIRSSTEKKYDERSVFVVDPLLFL